jgi:hypothetical protein
MAAGMAAGMADDRRRTRPGRFGSDREVTVGHAGDRHRFERYGHELDVRLRKAERRAAQAAAQHPASRQAVSYAARVPGLAVLAEPVERRIRRRERARAAALIAAAVACVAAAAAVVVTTRD